MFKLDQATGFGVGSRWGCLTVRGVAQGCNGLELRIRKVCGSIHEVICNFGDSMENSVFWGHHRGSDSSMAELHCIGYFICLGVV